MRNLEKWQKLIVEIWLVCASSFQIYTAAFGIFESRIQRSVHIIFFLTACFLLFPATKKSPKGKITLTDALLAIASLTTGLYILLNYKRLNLRFEYVTKVLPIEIILGTIAVIVVIEAVRRVVGFPMAITIVAFIFYIFICPFLPGILHYAHIPYNRIVENFYLLTDQGIFGSLTGISATFIAIFIIFGAFVQNSGVGKFFTDFACRIAGKSIGGPAKIAVISSGLFGSISGSSVANVYSTGTFTIPLMKKLGYKSKFAAAVESAASTGGLIMPPIMGAGAFIMSEITGIPYIKICLAASLGAIFYFLSIGFMVHFEASRLNLHSISNEKILSWKTILKQFYLLLPLFGLVLFLIKGYSPFKAAFYAIIITIFISFFNKNTAFTPKKLWDTLVLGGKNIVMVSIACAGAGLIISVVSNTGLGITVSSVIIFLSKGKLLIALSLVMLTSIILGMGLPATPAYIIAISVGGPALIKMGCGILSAHLFVFYFAILAAVTPPVAITAYAAASIAKSDPIKTGYSAFKLALAGFIIAYTFIYNPAILLQGSIFQIISTIFFLTCSILIMATSLIGWLDRKLAIWERLILLTPVPILIFPIVTVPQLRICTRVLIIILFGGYYIWGKIKNKGNINGS